jgi:hypothetical protein
MVVFQYLQAWRRTRSNDLYAEIEGIKVIDMNNFGSLKVAFSLWSNE